MLMKGPQFTGLITHNLIPHFAALSVLTSALSCGPKAKATRRLTERGTAAKARCYVLSACWNSQINGRGSSPNRGSIPPDILVPWAVIRSGRRQYLLLPWHCNGQLKRVRRPSWYLSGPEVTSCQIEEILLFCGPPLEDCCFLERLESGRYTGRDVWGKSGNT